MDMSHANNTSGVDRYMGTLLKGLQNYPFIKVHWIHLRHDLSILFHSEEQTPFYTKITIPLPQQFNEIILKKFWINRYNEQVYRIIRDLFEKKKNIILHIHTLNLIDLAIFIRTKIGCKIITHLHCIPWKGLYNSDTQRFNELYNLIYIKRKKKLTRKNLDELAELMPIIDEIHQKGFMGGTHYYDLSGNYLGKIGASDNVRFTTPSSYQSYIPINAEYGGSSFANAGSGTQIAFMQKHFGTGNIIINPSAKYAAGLDSSGNLVIDPNSSVWNNRYDILSTLDHETIHYNHRDYLKTDPNEIYQAEFTAYMTQISSSLYQQTSAAYKIEVAEALYEYSNNLNKGYSKDQIYSMCGVTT